MKKISEGRGQFDTAERQAEMSKPQRLPPLKVEELEPDAIKFVASVSQSFNNESKPDDMSEMFRTQLRHYPLFAASMGLYTFLLTKGDLSHRDRELAIMRILWLCGSPNPYAPHVDMARSIGMSEDDIKRVQEGSSAPGWAEHDRLILKAVEELYERQAMSDETYDGLAKTLTPRQQMELPSLVGCYMMSAVVHNTARTKMGAGNKGFYQID